MTEKIYNTVVEEIPDSDDVTITLDPELIERMGWTEDTVLVWEVTEDGKVYIKAK
jgi:hypothetical protein